MSEVDVYFSFMSLFFIDAQFCCGIHNSIKITHGILRENTSYAQTNRHTKWGLALGFRFVRCMHAVILCIDMCWTDFNLQILWQLAWENQLT